MKTTSERKLAENRLKMLTFAETLRNVSEACRKLGISRSQFYEYKKRFEQYGLNGLRTCRRSTRPTLKRRCRKW